MAVIVLGAGATRGCSFVHPTANPCLPPLDGDFFTQLQRVLDRKHQDLIHDVMADVVEMFGPNFDVTMETVFTTLEHTLRMLETTGDNRDFKKEDLRDKRNRLVQAVQVVFEGSLPGKGQSGHSSRTPQECTHHLKLVRDILRSGDEIVSFNYDCAVDYALQNAGDGKWNARYGYGFNLGPQGKALTGDKSWQPKDPAKKLDSIHLYKLHGSLHFHVPRSAGRLTVHLKERPYTKQRGNPKFTIIPPEWHKAYDKGVFTTLWQKAAAAIHHAEHLVLIGYSLRPTDLHSTALFRTSVRKGKLKSLVVVNPDREARRRTRAVLLRGLSPDTRVLSFDLLSEFVAADQGIWRI
ncbi:MAG: SIR2 family protein [Planctomycetota bacterium]